VSQEPSLGFPIDSTECSTVFFDTRINSFKVGARASNVLAITEKIHLHEYNTPPTSYETAAAGALLIPPACTFLATQQPEAATMSSSRATIVSGPTAMSLKMEGEDRFRTISQEDLFEAGLGLAEAGFGLAAAKIKVPPVAMATWADYFPADLNTPEVYELEVPVIGDLWNLEAAATAAIQLPTPVPLFASDLMHCVNPWDVEGKQEPEAEDENEPENEPIANEDNDNDPDYEPEAKRSKKKIRANLKLIMPKREPVPIKMEEQEGLTPALVRSLMKNSEASFDLLRYVTDSSVKLDDPTVIDFLGTSPSVVTPEPIECMAPAIPSFSVPSKGKRRQRKQTEKAREASEADKMQLLPAPTKRRGRPPSKTVPVRSSTDHSYDSSSSSAFASSDDVKEGKYRRMRDLNNEASKRCRQKRKSKFETILESEESLRERNAELKMRAKQLAELVERLKERFVGTIANPNGLDLAAMAAAK
jgi:hypothetical protein